MGNVLKNPHLVKLLKLAGAFALILLVHVNVAGVLASRQLKVSQDFLSKAFQDTFRSVPQKVRDNLIKNPEELRKYVDQKVKELDQKIQLVSKAQVAMGTLFKKVSASFPESVKVDVNTLELNDKQLLIKGTLYQGDINQVVESLKATTYFMDLNAKAENGKFEIKGRVVVR